jgi:hypothetical protein
MLIVQTDLKPGDISGVGGPSRPQLPTSIKKLNRLLGRQKLGEVPEHELKEQFVRGKLVPMSQYPVWQAETGQVRVQAVKRSTRLLPLSLCTFTILLYIAGTAKETSDEAGSIYLPASESKLNLRAQGNKIVKRRAGSWRRSSI